MIEVSPNLYVGSAADLIHVDDGNGGIKDGWFVITAARDPWHRAALGYTGRGAPKEHHEYLMARRGNRLLMNLIDGADPAYVPDQLIDVALEDISVELAKGNKVLIHCNKGESRAPTIAMLWLARNRSSMAASIAEYRALDTPEAIIAKFKEIYPAYAPAEGMRLYAERRLTEMLLAKEKAPTEAGAHATVSDQAQDQA